MCSDRDENIICSVNYLPRNNSSRLVLRWDGDYKWTSAFVWCKSDGVLNPKVARATGCGASSLRFLHFWPCILVQGPVEERKKNPELVMGVITSSLDYSQLFPTSRQGCKGNSILMEYLPKEKGVPHQCAIEEGLVVRTGRFFASCVQVRYSGARGQVIPWPEPPPRAPGGRCLVTCETSP